MADDTVSVTDTNDDIDVVNLGDILQGDHSNESVISLPSHETCASHSLNLLATNDADKACNANAQFKRLYRSGLAKCTAIWNATRRSSKASDEVKKITDRSILSPMPTRWNSQYDAIKRLLELGDKLNDISDALTLPRFTSLELECLEEFILVMTPVAVALDKLQSDSAFYGNLFPTLYTVVLKLESFQHLTHANEFAAALLESFKQRFEVQLTFNASNAKRIVAAVTHPYFKLRWIPEDRINLCRTLFINAAKAEAARIADKNAVSGAIPAISQFASTDGDFFLFDVATEEQGVLTECNSFLNNSSTGLIMLNQYKTICSLFFKFNTTLPSSAPVERLFSTAGLIQVPRRNCLSDLMFEKLLLLKTNAASSGASASGT